MPVRTVIDLRDLRAGVQTRAITVGDKALTIVTNTQAQSAQILSPVNSSTQKNINANLDGTYGFSDLAKKSSPLVTRPGAMYLNSKDVLYGNRPKIEILNLSSLGTTNSPAVKTFDQMILGQTQETDAEKTDVHETFGVPFFFASGRFVRRVTFSGLVRAAPVNYTSSINEQKVTQYALLRLFYDNYMRISVQALKGWYTRLTVNNEVFEGFVSTCNFSASAENEHVIQFTFSMYCVDRRNDIVDGAASAILGINSSGGISGAQKQSQAQAEVSDALAKTSLVALPNSTDMGVLNFNNPVPSGVSRSLIHLTFSPRPELLRVRSDLPGIEPVYAPAVFGGRRSNVPLHGTVPPLVGPFPIDFKITDYWALYNAVFSKKQNPTKLVSQGEVKTLPPGEVVLLPGVANFSIITASKDKFALAVRFMLTPPAHVVVGEVRGYIGGGSTTQIGQGSNIPPNSDNTEIFLGEVLAEQTYVNNVASIQLRFFLKTPDGSPIPPDALNGATVVYDVQSVTPVLGESLLPCTGGPDLSVCNAAFTLNNTLTAVPEEGSFHNEFTIKLDTAEVMATTNPFAEADRVLVRMRPTITLVGYPAIKMPTLSMAIVSVASPIRFCLKQLLFVGSSWQPVQTQVKITETKTSHRLDKFGTLKFLITTTDGYDVPRSVYAAIKRGTLTFQTRYATQTAQSSARIDPVPLSGTAYGTGELIDPDTQQKVYVRNKMVSLEFDKNLGGLILTLEINTSYQSGFAAFLYSARFWAYVSEVVSASLNVPQATTIVPPRAWAKGQ